MNATLSPDEIIDLESLRDYLAPSDYTDRARWLAAIDRALGRDPVSNALGQILRPRKYRHGVGHGALKALVAATPPGGVLAASNYARAQCLRNAATHLGRRVKVRQAVPGKPKRNVTLLT